jgi:hypothetical protein
MTEEVPRTNILTTADPEWSIAEIFNREPLELYQKNPEQFRRLILELRAHAERNRAAEEAGKRIPRSPKMADSLPVKTDLSIEELLFPDDKA